MVVVVIMGGFTSLIAMLGGRCSICIVGKYMCICVYICVCMYVRIYVLYVAGTMCY